MNTGIPMSGSTVKKPHLIENGIRIQWNTENFVPIVVPGLSTSSSSSLPSSTSMTSSRQEIDHPTSSSSSSTSPTMTFSTVSSNSETRAWEDLWIELRDPLLPKPTKNPKLNENEDHDQERRDLCHSEIPEWLQEFRENLVDDRGPEHRDSHASSSHGSSLEPSRSADSGKYSVYTHFPKDRNCEICQRTKITRTPCKRRIGGAVPRAANFGDLITADHKVLREGCESRKIIDMQSWCRTWPSNGSSRIRAKQNFTGLGIRQSMWRAFLESLCVDTTQIGNKWDSWESSTQSERRYICSIVAIRSGWKLVGRFYGMLYLSAKHSRSLVRWENSIRKAFWRAI